MLAFLHQSFVCICFYHAAIPTQTQAYSLCRWNVYECTHFHFANRKEEPHLPPLYATLRTTNGREETEERKMKWAYQKFFWHFPRFIFRPLLNGERGIFKIAKYFRAYSANSVKFLSRSFVDGSFLLAFFALLSSFVVGKLATNIAITTTPVAKLSRKTFAFIKLYLCGTGSKICTLSNCSCAVCIFLEF